MQPDGTYVLEENTQEIEDDFDLSGILLDIKHALNMPESVYMTFVKNAEPDLLGYLSDVIRKSWEKQQIDHKDKVFTVFDYSLTVLLASSSVRDDLRRNELLDNAGAVMYSKDRKDWNALILYIDENYTVVDAEEIHITPESFTPYDWKRVQIIGQQLINRGK